MVDPSPLAWNLAISGLNTGRFKARETMARLHRAGLCNVEQVINPNPNGSFATRDVGQPAITGLCVLAYLSRGPRGLFGRGFFPTGGIDAFEFGFDVGAFVE